MSPLESRASAGFFSIDPTLCGQRLRLGPLHSVEARDEVLPGDRTADGAVVAARPVPEHHRERAVRIEGDLRMLGVLPHPFRKNLARLLAQLEPGGAVPGRQAHGALLMQGRGQRNGNQKALILAPVHPGFIPSHPGPPPAVHGDGGVRLKFRARRQRLQRRQRSVLIGAELDVVIPLVVRVPGDVCRSIRSRGHRRLPVIGARFADPDFAGPLSIRERAQVNVALPAAVALPDQKNLAVRRRRRSQERIRSICRQALCPLPACALLLATPNLPPVILAFAPKYP